jgi:hypothetical protein
LDGSLLVWVATAAGLAGYAVLFLLARGPVAIRPLRVWAALLVMLAVRLALWPLGDPPAEWEGALAGVILFGGIGVYLQRRCWLVRVAGDEFREQIQTGCRGLFITVEEPRPGRFRLSAREGELMLELRRVVGRIHLLQVPTPPGKGKLALLVSWLSKQYPGPIPRVRIILHRSES